MATTNTSESRLIENIAGDTPYIDITGDMVGDRIYLDPQDTGGFQIGKTITSYALEEGTSGNKAGTWNQLTATPTSDSSAFVSASVNMAKQTGANKGGSVKGTETYAIFEGTDGLSGGTFGNLSFASYRGTDPNNNNSSSTDVQGLYVKADTRTGSSGEISYMMGANIISEMNGSVNVDYLQGAHVTVKTNSGTVEGGVSAIIVDLDGTGATVNGDLEYLRIQNDGMPTVTGVARAINSLSVLPSLFNGSVEAAGLNDSAITEHADNSAAIAAGLSVGTHYRTGDLLKIVH